MMEVIKPFEDHGFLFDQHHIFTPEFRQINQANSKTPNPYQSELPV